MKKKKKQQELSVKELEHDFPNLLPPTQNVEENLARGDDDLIPDVDDIPGVGKISMINSCQI